MKWWVQQIYRNYTRYQNYYIHQGSWKIEKELLKRNVSFPMETSKYQDHYIEPGRWKSKKDVEKWMEGHHPDPGYPNFTKNEKLKELKIKNSGDGVTE